ncbi:MAG: Rieske (2Fe-2S) protein [Gemmatimonadota bacterium]|nr:Rieske (2Fe-2S) protein [Gemmatimonadota bacterium]
MGDTLNDDLQAERQGGLGFNELLLGAVIALIIAGIALGTALYVSPGDHLEIPELQPVIRVTQERDLPVGASRLIRWGDRAVLVVRLGQDRFAAVDGTSPNDGCLLRWEEDASRIVSPCSYVVYDVDGSVVSGLSTRALQRFPVFLRDGIVYVGRS